MSISDQVKMLEERLREKTILVEHFRKESEKFKVEAKEYKEKYSKLLVFKIANNI